MTSTLPPLSIWSESHLCDNRGNRVIQKTLLVENEISCGMFGKTEFHAIRVMGLPTPQGMQMHQYTFLIRGAITAMEAFEMAESQKDRGMREEVERLKADAKKQSLRAL